MLSKRQSYAVTQIALLDRFIALQRATDLTPSVISMADCGLVTLLTNYQELLRTTQGLTPLAESGIPGELGKRVKPELPPSTAS